ncbi:hypothetical protein DFA_00912 [Cavenderia fasciculata]|uniref:Uncharacterized protein n=1 Tax=Cavenderia fasciculata TaxID=261658 RepID=F4PUH0_CACFS|nr:uncharacterized protein DFA_00912 [Cavenderia fasciculata]EGG21042.1 hypothetical protein DFA_00912 [Cavenderia fasciculata]|eukprot:XP_004358892.1 hypothetical protein DFA_00912 [Cavenderia fasciculata]
MFQHHFIIQLQQLQQLQMSSDKTSFKLNQHHSKSLTSSSVPKKVVKRLPSIPKTQINNRMSSFTFRPNSQRKFDWPIDPISFFYKSKNVISKSLFI